MTRGDAFVKGTICVVAIEIYIFVCIGMCPEEDEPRRNSVIFSHINALDRINAVLSIQTTTNKSTCKIMRNSILNKYQFE